MGLDASNTLESNMLAFLFRVKYPDLKWRVKNATDLFNHKLVRMWQASDEDCRILQILDNCTGRE